MFGRKDGLFGPAADGNTFQRYVGYVESIWKHLQNTYLPAQDASSSIVLCSHECLLPQLGVLKHPGDSENFQHPENSGNLYWHIRYIQYVDTIPLQTAMGKVIWKDSLIALFISSASEVCKDSFFFFPLNETDLLKKQNHSTSNKNLSPQTVPSGTHFYQLSTCSCHFLFNLWLIHPLSSIGKRPCFHRTKSSWRPGFLNLPFSWAMKHNPWGNIVPQTSSHSA